MLDYKVNITVHAYEEGHLNDSILVPHSKNYGIHGKEIIAPLRKINNHIIEITDVPDNFSVRELWCNIFSILYGMDFLPEDNSLRSSNFKYDLVKKYLVFSGLRYAVDHENPLQYYLHRMEVSENKIVNVQLLICLDAGEVLKDKDEGIRYFIKSNESSCHHCPHVHVDVKHECSGTFSIKTGEQLAGNIKRVKYLKKIKNTILSRQYELLELWNRSTDGLNADLNQFLGIIDY